MSPASVQPHIPSFPAIPAKTKAEEAAFAPCRMCWGVQSSPTAVPGSREGGPRGFAEAQGQERGAGAQSGRGGCPEGSVPSQSRVRHSPRNETWHPLPSPPPGHSPPQPWPAAAAPEELLRDLGTSSEQCPGRGLPLAPQQVLGLLSRFGLGCCTALGNSVCSGNGL